MARAAPPQLPYPVPLYAMPRYSVTQHSVAPYHPMTQ